MNNIEHLKEELQKCKEKSMELQEWITSHAASPEWGEKYKQKCYYIGRRIELEKQIEKAGGHIADPLMPLISQENFGVERRVYKNKRRMAG